MATTWSIFQHEASAAPEAEVEWDAVFTGELPRIYNFFRYRLDDSDLAEDLTAATFEKAWRARARYRKDRAAFSTWLYTIARNVATDYFRRRRDDLPLDVLREVPAPQTPAELSERQAEYAELSALLVGLPARERELIALKHGAELSNREIARLTRLSESNVGTILARVTARLRAQRDEANR
jgi:RNA polymerase sigma-70 factor, ECF subfamily